MEKPKSHIYIVFFIIITIISIISFSLALYLYFDRPRIAYVYNSRILSEYLGVKEAHQSYLEKKNEWQANLDTLSNDLNKQIQDYNIKKAQMNTHEKNLTEQLIKKREQELIYYKDALESKAKEEENKLSQEILNQINSFILDYAKSSNYDYILGVTDNGSIHYGRKGDDITDDVLQALNNKYRGN